MTGGYGDDTLDGGTENDTLNGFEGNDTLLGQDGNDALFGEGQNDTISGGLGSDIEVGDAGDDTVIEDGGAANGADNLSGNAGTDTLSYKSRTVSVVVDLDAATADDGEDTNGDGVADEGDTVAQDFENLEGGAGNDTLTGQPGLAVANALSGNGGTDVLNGNEGDDTLDGGLGPDTLNGGAGTDTSTYATRGARLRVDIGGALDGTDFDNNGVAEEGDTTATDIENLIGGKAPDLLIGYTSNNALSGNGGNDDLRGLGGADTLDGGDGNDKLAGGPSDDIEHGGPGGDSFNQGGALDGADDLAGESGTDTADYSARSKTLAIRLDAAANDGEDTNLDRFGWEEGDNVHADIERVRGGKAPDTLIGSGLADTLYGNGGGDLLAGPLGPDTMDGGTGIDTVSYDLRTASVFVTPDGVDANDGEPGEQDNVLGTVENLLGGQDGDFLFGNASANVLEGLGGWDFLDGKEGPDVMRGGAGVDVADYTSRSVSVRVTLDDLANDGTDGSLDGFSEEFDNVQSDVENVRGGSAPDSLTGDGDDNQLSGEGGDDQALDGQGGRDVLIGGAGNDLGLYGGDGDDTLFGEAGNDDFFEGPAPSGADVIWGGSGDLDRVHYSARLSRVTVFLDDLPNDGDFSTSEGDNIHTDVEDAVGGSGPDGFQGSSADNHFLGGNGNDGMQGRDGRDSLFGGADNDTLDGGDDFDMLAGGPGNDTEEGGASFDTMQEESGPNGQDLFTDSDQRAKVDYSARTAPVVVDIDGVPDDGAPGESDFVTGSITEVVGGSADDTLTGGWPSGTGRLDGGPGNDTLNAVNGDNLFGGLGDDTLNGGPGNDILKGYLGNDREFGNGGNDSFQDLDVCLCTPDGSDQLVGGSGTDEVNYGNRSGDVTVTLDGVPDDGGSGEFDNVFADVENIRGGYGNDTLTGSFFINRISGNLGNDTITGGNSADDMFGDGGDDTFHALDGVVDNVDGGTGTDVAADFDSADVLVNIP